MPPVSEPRRPVSASKSWRERPRRRARGVAPRLSGRVVHATTCLSVSERCGVTDRRRVRAAALTMDLRARSRAHSAGGSGPRSQRVSAPDHPPDLRALLTGRVLARPARLSAWSCARRRQGSALRSDPADAGPADLDGVCAQLANLALTCRPWSACWPGAHVREADT